MLGEQNEKQQEQTAGETATVTSPTTPKDAVIQLMGTIEQGIAELVQSAKNEITNHAYNSTIQVAEALHGRLQEVVSAAIEDTKAKLHEIVAEAVKHLPVPPVAPTQVQVTPFSRPVPVLVPDAAAAPAAVPEGGTGEEIRHINVPGKGLVPHVLDGDNWVPKQ